MKKLFVFLLAGLALSVPLLSQDRDAKADAAGHEFLSALGGEAAWANSPWKKSDFVGMK